MGMEKPSKKDEESKEEKIKKVDEERFEMTK